MTNGERITYTTGTVTITVQQVTEYAFKVSTTHAGTAFEIPALTNSYTSEAQARSVAREIALWARDGRPASQIPTAILWK